MSPFRRLNLINLDKNSSDALTKKMVNFEKLGGNLPLIFDDHFGVWWRLYLYPFILIFTLVIQLAYWDKKFSNVCLFIFKANNLYKKIWAVIRFIKLRHKWNFFKKFLEFRKCKILKFLNFSIKLRFLY